MVTLPPAAARLLSFKYSWRWGVPVAAIVAAIVLWLLQVNQPLFLFINRSSAWTGDGVWATLTILGDAAVVFAVLLLFAGRPRVIWPAALATLLALLWVHGLKGPLGFLRPSALLSADLFHVIGPVIKAKSFPSGHTTAAFTVAGVLCLQPFHNGAKAVILLVALLAGLSRIVVGAHWPLDVLAGAFGGWLAAVAGAWLADRWAWGYGVATQRILVLWLAAAAVWLLAGHDTRYPQAVWLQYLIGAAALMWSAPALWRLYGWRRA